MLEGWRAETVIHGDIRPDNVLVRNGHAEGPWEVRIIDWEMVQLGDPAWDLAGTLQAFVRAWVVSIPMTADLSIDERTALAKFPFENVQALCRSFWQGYRAELAADRVEERHLLDRAVKLTAVRMIQSAYEMSHELMVPDPRSVIMLQLSWNVFVRPEIALCAALRHHRERGDFMTELHPDLWSVLDAVVIDSRASFTALDEHHELVTPAADGFSGDLAPPWELALSNILYRLLYIRPSRLHASDSSSEPRPRQRLSALHAANTGRGTWQGGWVVSEVDVRGHLALGKAGLTVWAAPEEVYTPEKKPTPGRTCAVWVGKEQRIRVPGFYFADGEALDECGEDDSTPLIRYYWHLTSDAAVPFVAAATERLNADKVPFCLKVLADPHAFRRADAGLIFLRRRYEASARDAIAHIHAAVEPGLRESAPLFTKQIARGLGAAESPSGPVSFGDHRCKLAARALWRSFLRGDRDRAARAATFAGVYKEEGLDPRFPYLAAGSTDHFQPLIAPVPREPTTAEGPTRRSISPREAAIRIGESLCRQAVWDLTGADCNWIGRVHPSETGPDASTGEVTAALGPGLREGSAGIALFLAQLHALTGHAEFRRTAAGAFGRSRLPLLDPARDAATGIPRGPGKAREAAMLCLLAMQDAELKERRLAQARTAITLLLEALDAHIKAPRFDTTIRNGLAGLGEVLLSAGLMIGDHSYIDHARELAQTLIDRYSERDNWPTGFPGGGANPSLYLGTAGIGYWLLRLEEPERIPCWLLLDPDEKLLDRWLNELAVLSK